MSWLFLKLHTLYASHDAKPRWEYVFMRIWDYIWKCLSWEFRELGIVSPRIISSDTPKRRCMLVNNHARKQFFWKEWSLFWSAAVICLQWLCRLVLEDNGRLVVKDPCELYTHALHKQVGPTPPPIVNTALALAFSMSEKVSSWRCEGAISGES